ncbi:Synapse-associated protein 1 [Irineochytrium annulatum]|nr:Synapse-associated protein 1 [Irineochytrium annulatum]
MSTADLVDRLINNPQQPANSGASFFGSFTSIIGSKAETGSASSLFYNPNAAKDGTGGTDGGAGGSASMSTSQFWGSALERSVRLHRANHHVIHIAANPNNTVVSLHKHSGEKICWASGGTCGLKKSQRGVSDVGYQAILQLAEKAEKKNVKVVDVEVKMKGFGKGREMAFRAVRALGWNLRRITDVTPIRHGGCRPKKARRSKTSLPPLTMFANVTSFASSLASKVQRTVADAARDFENQRREFVDAKDTADAEEKPPVPVLPTINPAAVQSVLTSGLALLAGTGAKAAEPPADHAAAAAGAASGATRAGSEATSPRAEASSPIKEVGAYLERVMKEPSSPIKEVGGFLERVLLRRESSGGVSATSATSVGPPTVDPDCLPWKGAADEDLLRKQIFALSTDKRTFLADPPEGTDFVYDMNSSFPIATALLKVDPQLQRMRFQLVPKQIKEPKFWRNYFYRVSLVKFATMHEGGQSAPVAAIALSSSAKSSPAPKASALKPDTTATPTSTPIPAPGSPVKAAGVIREGTPAPASPVKVTPGTETAEEKADGLLAAELEANGHSRGATSDAGDEFVSDNWEEELENEIKDAK